MLTAATESITGVLDAVFWRLNEFLKLAFCLHKQAK
jgi:hypothetical protein